MNNKELAELDLAVAKAEGWPAAIHADRCWTPNAYASDAAPYEPTRDGAEAMRLLEKYRLLVCPKADGEWEAGRGYTHVRGPTPAIAICRAVVALSAPEARAEGPTTAGRNVD